MPLAFCTMIITVALYGSAAVGANVTRIVQLPPGGSGASQRFVTLHGLPPPLNPSISTDNAERAAQSVKLKGKGKDK